MSCCLNSFHAKGEAGCEGSFMLGNLGKASMTNSCCNLPNP